MNSGTKVALVLFLEQEEAAPSCGAQRCTGKVSLWPGPTVYLEVLPDDMKMAPGVESSLGHNQTLRN